MNKKQTTLLAATAFTVLAACGETTAIDLAQPKTGDSTKSGCETASQPLPPWQNPEVNAINRLPARSAIVPCESEAKAKAIAELAAVPEDSAFYASLDREWDFTWTSGKPEEAARTTKITVPGCWQLQGDFDPPLYTNVTYPFAKTPPVAGGETAEHPDWTVNRYPDPVGVYERTFSIPAAWNGRRIVIRFAGVSSAMSLYVNGKEVGYSEDSRLPAEFDITPFLAPNGEKNALKVVVRKFCDGSYLEDQDFWRFSGIFRSVSLIASEKDGLYDFTAKADAKTGNVTVKARVGSPDAPFSTVYETSVPGFRLWTVEDPALYTIAFKVGKDWYARAVGFRTVSIEDKVLKVNGKRIIVKGVNRHEMTADKGYTITREEMLKDVKVLKEFGFNAVRTCHYPSDPHFFDLCDKYGLYVTCEANIESHGMYYNQTNSFSKLPEWLTPHLERGGRMVENFRDHPSIIVWSMGNESDMGPAFEKEYAYIKELDAEKRPVQYEQARDSEWTDIRCPMYAPARDQEKYVADPEHKKPFILCEYAHAMGNSTGSFRDYWDNVAKYPSAQGGYIWDFADQAVWQTLPDGTRRLAFGGDFGDKPNDYNFNCNGIFDALRNPHPGAWEAKKVFEDASHEHKKADEILKDIRPNFWRAPTDNDRGWKMPKDCAVWKKATATGVLPEGCHMLLETIGNAVKFEFSMPDKLPLLPRAGVTFKVPAAFNKVTWLGRGPHENYPDRRESAKMGTWSMTVDELNDSHYSIPSEMGHRCDVYRLELSDGKRKIVIEAPGDPFGFNVWPWTQEDLEAAQHEHELPRRDFLTVCIDAAMMGVGGDDSWSKRGIAHDGFRLKPNTRYRLRFTVTETP